MEKNSKAETFIGFVLRTKRYKIGTNAVGTLKKASLIILCRSASDNLKKEAEKYSKKFHCPMLITIEKNLEDLTHRENAKIMAITDVPLSKAIIENKDQVFSDGN